MFFSLFAAVSCLEEPEGYIELNRVTFRRYVQARQPYQPWIVVFHKNTSEKVEECTPILEELAEKSYGYFFVGHVDMKKEPLLAHDFKIKNKWSAMLFNSKGQQILDFPCDRTRYNKVLLESIPETVQEVDPDWLKTTKKKSAVVLFARAFNVPVYWKAVGAYFKDKGLRVGLCTEKEYFPMFGARERGTTIKYMNSSGLFNVPFSKDYKKLRENIELMHQNKPLPEKNTDVRMFMVYRFREKCQPGNICVLHAARSIDPRFERKEVRFSDKRLLFFSGVRNLPYKFIKDDSIWIFNGERTKKFQVPNIQELDKNIKLALAGKLQMEPMNEEL